jgi:hypothetical protein
LACGDAARLCADMGTPAQREAAIRGIDAYFAVVTISLDAVQELAAPAVLKRLQMSAAKFAAQEDDAEARLDALRLLSPNAAETQENKGAIARAECDLLNARDNFNKTAKALLNYDRGVAIERKEGEKASIEECREWIKHILDCVQIAHQKCRITMAQAAAKANSPEDFVVATDGSFSAEVKNAISSALEDGVLPKFIGA